MKSGSIFISAIICITVFVLTAGTQSCKKEKADSTNKPTGVASIDVQRIWDCHNNTNPYPSQIAARIEGTWVWQSKQCGHSANTQSAGKHVVVTFNDGGLYKVFESSRIVSEGSWSLKQDGNSWVISTTASSEYLNGYVLLCEKELICYSGYLDGCNYYFVKN